MSQMVRDVMTSEPVTVPSTATVLDAAQAMKRDDVGNVLVMDDGRLCGIVTDRDIVVRALAERRDPAKTKIGELCSRDLSAVRPSDDIDKAITLMRNKAVRRLPVVDAGRPVGVVSLGDLARDRDPHSALADISAAPPTH